MSGCQRARPTGRHRGAPTEDPRPATGAAGSGSARRLSAARCSTGPRDDRGRHQHASRARVPSMPRRGPGRPQGKAPWTRRQRLGRQRGGRLIRRWSMSETEQAFSGRDRSGRSSNWSGRRSATDGSTRVRSAWRRMGLPWCDRPEPGSSRVRDPESRAAIGHRAAGSPFGRSGATGSNVSDAEPLEPAIPIVGARPQVRRDASSSDVMGRSRAAPMASGCDPDRLLQVSTTLPARRGAPIATPRSDGRSGGRSDGRSTDRRRSTTWIPTPQGADSIFRGWPTALWRRRTPFHGRRDLGRRSPPARLRRAWWS